jgi:uncharacterized protein YjiS (DUF1127 family)
MRSNTTAGTTTIGSLSRPARRSDDGPLARRLARWWRHWLADCAWRRTHAALEALDDRALRDLGMHRSEIASFCSEAGGAARTTRRRVRPAPSPSPQPSAFVGFRRVWR